MTLGHVSLPAVVSSGLSGTRERDRTSDRSLPNDLAALSSGTVLFPQPGGLGKYSYQFKYKYGVGLEVTDILSGYLDGTLKVTFLFFSKKFSQRLATFASPINIPPTMLIGGEGGTELGGEIGGGGYDGVVADGAAPWRTAHESVPFLSLNRLPAAPAGLVADASFDTAKVVGLFYDEVCEQCSPSGDTCERDADCCDKPGDVCVAGSGGQGVCGPPVCLNSLAPCTTADDCCGQNSCLRQLNGEFACSRQVRDSGNGATCYGDGLDAHLCANYCSVRTPTGSQQTPQAGVCETVVK